MKKLLITLNTVLSITSLTIITPTTTNNSETIIKIENQSINVNISAYDENNKKLISYHYQTTFTTLGELMQQKQETYLLKDYGQPLGLYLYGINYFDATGKKQTKLEEPNATFWAFWYINNKGEEELSPVGISSYYLTNSTENIIWRYTKLTQN